MAFSLGPQNKPSGGGILLGSCDLRAACLRARFSYPEEVLEAGRHVVQRPIPAGCSEHSPRFAPESRWRKSSKRVEAGAKGAQAFIAGIETDVSDAMIAGQEQLLGVIDPQARHKLMRSFVEGFREQALEVERRQSGVSSGF